MNPAPLFTAAATGYAANVALGVAVATRTLDTSGFRWLHHALFTATSALTALAASSLLWSRDPRARAGWALLPAVLPLSLIPFVSARRRAHVVLALAAAPWFALSTVESQLSARRARG